MSSAGVREDRVPGAGPQAAGGSQGNNQEQVVRPKDYKNREGRNSVKLSNSRNITSNLSSRPSQSSRTPNNSDSLRQSLVSRSNVSPGWTPHLRTVRYDDDDITLSSIENKPKKVPNSNKQRKDDANMKLNQNTHVSNDALGSGVSHLNLPHGLTQSSNTRFNQGNKIYLKSSNSNPGQMSNVNNKVEKSVKVSESPNLVQYKNTWTKKQGPPVKESNIQGSIAQSMQTDIEMDSEQPSRSNTTFLRLEAPTLPRTPSATDLTSRPIVVSYEHQRRSLSDSSLLHLNCPSLDSLNSVNSIPITSTTALAFTQPTNSSPVYAGSNSYLPSNLPSSALFGNGIVSTDEDYKLAQELQRKFDRESEARMNRNGYDIAPTQAFRACGAQSPQIYTNNNGFSSLDFITDSMPMMNSLNDTQADTVGNMPVPMYRSTENRRHTPEASDPQESSRQNIPRQDRIPYVNLMDEPNMVTHLHIAPPVNNVQSQPNQGVVYIPFSQDDDNLCKYPIFLVQKL